MADVTLESTEEIIQLVSVSGASQGDIVAAVAVETAAREAADAAHTALTTGVHGVGASTVASAADVTASIAAHNALATAHTAVAHTWTAGQTFQLNAIFGKTDPGGLAGEITLEMPTISPFRLAPAETTAFGHPNPTILLGYNVTAGGGKIDPNVADYYFGLEADWYSDANTHVAEFYIRYHSADYVASPPAGTFRQPLSGTINLETWLSSFNLNGNVSINTSDGVTNTFNVNELGDATILHSLTINTNNTYAIAQKNSSGVVIPLIYIDNFNEVIIGPAGAAYTTYIQNAFHLGLGGGATRYNFYMNTQDAGSGVGVIGIHDATTAPSSDPADGGALYSTSATLTWRGAGGINLVTGTAYKVAGIQVVGARVVDARCDDTINSGDATTDGVIDALRDAMIAHGLIAAA